MGSLLKNDTDLLTLNIISDGPIKGLLVSADSKGIVKGYPYVNNIDIPLKENGKLDVSSAVGSGYLNVIRDTGLKTSYSGQIQLVSGEIAEDLTYYYATSEQIPSSISLGVLVNNDLTVKHSGGFMIQLMPETNDDIITKLENKLTNLPSFTTLTMKYNSLEEIIQFVLKDFDVKITEEKNVQFKCNCNKNKVEKALIAIGKKELKIILKEDEKANLHCNICNKNYDFTKEDLKKLINKIN